MPIARIIFLDGDEGRRVVDALTHADGPVSGVVSAASIEAVVDHLAQWDDGEYADVHAHTGQGALDPQVQVDAYLLSWNTGLGYVSLEAVMDVVTGRPIEVSTCRGCDKPVDMCLDHTHAPDMDSEAWADEYDAATAALS